MKLAWIIGVPTYLPTYLVLSSAKRPSWQAGRQAGTPSKLTGWLDTQFGWAAAEYMPVCLFSY